MEPHSGHSVGDQSGMNELSRLSCLPTAQKWLHISHFARVFKIRSMEKSHHKAYDKSQISVDNFTEVMQYFSKT